QGVPKPFTEVIKANIGDAHAMGQRPITFLRQVTALCLYPELLADPSLPEDAKARARRLLAACGGQSAGAYSASPGIELVRQDVARFLQRRDGVPANANNIFLSTGASDAIVVRLGWGKSSKTGMGPWVLTGTPGLGLLRLDWKPMTSLGPLSWNPKTTGTSGLGLHKVMGWGLPKPNQYWHGAPHYQSPDASSSGQVQSRECIENVIKFAFEEKLFLMADEVYQDNVYAEGSAFHSFKKVLFEMGPPYSEVVELASFHSISKGFMGECGFRGGYVEVVNMDPEVQQQLVKLVSVRLCPPVPGQILLDAVVDPPQPGDPSYERFMTVRDGMGCCGTGQDESQASTEAPLQHMAASPATSVGPNHPLHPLFVLPAGHMHGAELICVPQAQGQTPDMFFCMKLLEETGICVVPGSGFGQREGTFHFRMTILPPTEKLQVLLEKLSNFYAKFVKEYS
ncbi:ALAT2 aminotransferase, partial [Chloroceryle aenea]|nr:ALAT2 aminotransferase [Chloroceryle aenea]